LLEGDGREDNSASANRKSSKGEKGREKEEGGALCDSCIGTEKKGKEMGAQVDPHRVMALLGKRRSNLLPLISLPRKEGEGGVTTSSILMAVCGLTGIEKGRGEKRGGVALFSSPPYAASGGRYSKKSAARKQLEFI